MSFYNGPFAYLLKMSPNAFIKNDVFYEMFMDNYGFYVQENCFV